MDLPFYDAMHHEKVKKSLEEKEFKGTYQIYASDRDPEMIAIAKRNALRA